MSGERPPVEPSQEPAAAAPEKWKRTEKWKPCRVGTASAGFGVENEVGEVGFCKNTGVAQEWICSQLAREVGVNVPEARLGRLEGQAVTSVISLAHGKESADLAKLRESPALSASPRVQDSIRAGSGLLAFHAWVGSSDLKDEHLVISDDGGDGFVVAAIDFADAMRWGDQPEPVQAANGPPSLIAAPNPDKLVVQAAVEKIEGCTDERIVAIVGGVTDDVLPPAEKNRLIRGLQSRRGLVRAVMRDKGWLP
jgi:hypothetical protein